MTSRIFGYRIRNDILVADDLKRDWRLFIDGDRVNFSKIFDEVQSVDLFHYDSDKSYVGRQFAMETIKSKLVKNAIVIFDNINDNTHFYDYVTYCQCVNFKVFRFEGKYVGLIGRLE